MTFDFNKLDDYKKAIDDRLLLTKFENHKLIEISVFKGDYTFCVKNLGSFRLIRNQDMILDKNWEKFKKKVASYFLEVEESGL